MKMLTVRNQNILLYVCALCSFLIGVEALVISPLVPAISSTENFSTNIGGLLITLYALLYGLSAPLFGPMSDRWGRRKMIIIGMILFSLATVFLSFAKGLIMLLIFRGLAGIAGAMVMPSIYALIGDVFSDRRGRAMSIVTGAMSAATLLGIPAGSFLAASISWRITFFVLGVASLIVASSLRFIIPSDLKDHSLSKVDNSSRVLQPFRKVVSQPTALIALFCTFLWWAGFQGLFANMGAFYSNLFSLPVHVIGYIFSLSGLASLLGNIAGGRISDSIGRKPVIYGACILCGAAILSIPLMSNSLWMIIFLHAIWALATGFGQSSLTTMIAELNPQVRGTILSMNSSATYLGMTFSTALAVPLLGYGGFIAVGGLCSILVWLVIPLMLYQARGANRMENQAIKMPS